ncbi:hypothetical protein F2P81_017189 [Scophthalmus maximus]|uniref:Uncharacterized protein n=1 Tax=Scophthalmus maximus TaxID=52904 RepID=A0A6A4SDY1_SCOMX|nr:hypothetical protein F2P81_017189 [Scophthalmus maximus]
MFVLVASDDLSISFRTTSSSHTLTHTHTRAQTAAAAPTNDHGCVGHCLSARRTPGPPPHPGRRSGKGQFEIVDGTVGFYVQHEFVSVQKSCVSSARRDDDHESRALTFGFRRTVHLRRSSNEALSAGSFDRPD